MSAEFVKKTMDELNRENADDHKKSQDHFPIVLILDNVRSMNNVGSVFRTADALNASKIILCGLTPTPPHRDIQKTALGATESVNWEYYSSIIDAIDNLKKDGYIVLAIEQVHNSLSLEEFIWNKEEKIALVFGNEVEGVSEEALIKCDNSLEIPQFGAKHSLNISLSAGIVLWHLVLQAIK